MDKKSFGHALARERENHGMSAEGFARALGLTPEEYAAYENGEALPSLDLAKTFAEALGVPLDKLTAHKYVSEYRMKCDDGVSDAEKKAIEDEMERAEIERYNRGKKIMTVIVAAQAIVVALNFILGGFATLSGIVGAVLNIILLVCLYNGKLWARYVFVGLTVLGIISDIIFVTNVNAPPFFYVVCAAIILIRAIVCALLLWCKSVEEFLYEQSTR